MPEPLKYLPHVTERRDDWAEWEAMMASPPTDIIPNAWDALASRLTLAQREAAMRPGSALVLAGRGDREDLDAYRLGGPQDRGRKVSGLAPPRRHFYQQGRARDGARIRAALGDEAAPHWLGTFHGLGARQLRAAPEVAGLRPEFDILDADASRRMTKRIMKALNLASDEDAGGGRDPVKAISNKISSFKDRLNTAEAAAAQIETAVAAAARRGDPIDGQVFRNAARVYALYQQRLGDANAADFGDLLLWPTLAMQKDDGYRRQWAGRFDAILADEYQDVNHTQYNWLKAMASLCRRILAIGDDDQSIYGCAARTYRSSEDSPGISRTRQSCG
jgi:DNA helicase-2/ATP-dependent DNA helicase PcrA